MVRSLAHLSNREIAHRSTKLAIRPARAAISIVARSPTFASTTTSLRLVAQRRHLPCVASGQMAGDLPTHRHQLDQQRMVDAHVPGSQPWHVPFGPEIEAACRRKDCRIGTDPSSRHNGPPQSRTEHTVHEIATALGVSIYVVYYWISIATSHAAERSAGGWLSTSMRRPKTECRRRIAPRPRLNPYTMSKPHAPHARRQYEAIVPVEPEGVHQVDVGPVGF